MSHAYTLSRRHFLMQATAALAAATTPGWLSARPGMGDMPIIAPNRANPNFKADVEVDLFCRKSSAAILPGEKTQLLQYSAKLIHGPKDTLSPMPNSFLAPIVRLHKGQKVRIHLHNELAAPTITHWHGLHVPTVMDGQPQYAIPPGESYVYEFEVLNRASMNIIHPHPHGATAKQVYYGLAGALIVNDPEEAALDLPAGEFEIPLIIQDKVFDDQNQLIYAHSMHDRMLGHYGDNILVNGQANFQLNVASRAYRFRFLNGSTARIYKLAWDDGTPLTVIGVDGGLLEKPESRPYLMLAPGERLDVWADFSGRAEGTQLILRSLKYSGVLPQMAEGMGGGMGMGGMHQASDLPVGSDFAIFKVKVTRKMSDSPTLPTQLSQFKKYQLSDTANSNKPRPIAISSAHMSMLLNGRPFAYNDVQANEKIPVDSVQLLKIFHTQGGMGAAMADTDSDEDDNEHGMHHGGMGGMGMRHRGGMMGMGRGGMGGGMGMMMTMAHPIHLHGQAFQIVSRHFDPQSGDQADYATVNKGFIDNGLKDTVLVMPGESLNIIKPFEDFKGLFLYHCHNLEHEDMGMMRYFSVG